MMMMGLYIINYTKSQLKYHKLITMKLYCFTCHATVSTELPDDTVVRAITTCPDCIPEDINIKLNKLNNMYYLDTIPPRVKYYLLEWKDNNKTAYEKKYGELAVRDLSKDQIVALYDYVHSKDRNLIINN